MKLGLKSEKEYNIAYSFASKIINENKIYIGYQLGCLHGRGYIVDINITLNLKLSS